MKAVKVKRMEKISTKEDYDYLAPDGSEIRILKATKLGGMAHCTLQSGKSSKAIKHQTVEEIWYFLEGEGELWRKSQTTESVVVVRPNLAITISVDCHFQFRNTGNGPLKFLIITMPPWPGADEAISVEDYWK